jgi:hypothetical protein
LVWVVGAGVTVEEVARSRIVHLRGGLQVIVIAQVYPGPFNGDADVPFTLLPVPVHPFFVAGGVGGTFAVLLVLEEGHQAQIRTAVVQAVAVDVVNTLVGLGVLQETMEVEEFFLAADGDEATRVAAADIQPLGVAHRVVI